MKRTVMAALAASLLTSSLWAQAPPQQPPGGAPAPMPANLKTLKDQASYALGLNIARSFKDADLNPDLIAQGLKDQLAGKPGLNEQQVGEVLQSFMRQMQTQVADKNLKQGKDFLAANKTKPGIQTTASGLQYKVLKAGAGKKPTARDTVSAHYTGKLLNGDVFDSSVERGQPLTIEVGQVIKGWTEALQLMPEGSKWELYIPAELAYGANGPEVIGPNSTLVFEVELLKVLEPAGGLPKIQQN